jgi:hypothetical protein
MTRRTLAADAHEADRPRLVRTGAVQRAPEGAGRDGRGARVWASAAEEHRTEGTRPRGCARGVATTMPAAGLPSGWTARPVGGVAYG